MSSVQGVVEVAVAAEELPDWVPEVVAVAAAAAWEPVLWSSVQGVLEAAEPVELEGRGPKPICGLALALLLALLEPPLPGCPGYEGRFMGRLS